MQKVKKVYTGWQHPGTQTPLTKNTRNESCNKRRALNGTLRR